MGYLTFIRNWDLWMRLDNLIRVPFRVTLIRGSDAQLVSDKYFFETVVRIHRAGEKMSFEGIKPRGTPVDEKILKADKAIESGDLSRL